MTTSTISSHILLWLLLLLACIVTESTSILTGLRRRLQATEQESCHGQQYACNFYYKDGGGCSKLQGCAWTVSTACPNPGCCAGVSKNCDEIGTEISCLSQGCQWGIAPRTKVQNCFSGLVTVVGRQGPMAMKDLKVGDHVLTGTGRYQPVYAFGHYAPTKQAEFLQLEIDISYQNINATSPAATSHAITLEVTRDHLIHVMGKKHPTAAASIHVGDSLQTILASSEAAYHGFDSTAQVAIARVIQINQIEREGVYAPLTPDGTIITQGLFLASTYTTLQQEQPQHEGGEDDNMYVHFQGSLSSWLPKLSHQELSHTCAAPLRLFCLWTRSRWCHPPDVVATVGNRRNGDDGDGMPTFVTKAIRVAHWLDQQGAPVQMIVWILFVTLRNFVIAPLDHLTTTIVTDTTTTSNPADTTTATTVIIVKSYSLLTLVVGAFVIAMLVVWWRQTRQTLKGRWA